MGPAWSRTALGSHWQHMLLCYQGQAWGCSMPDSTALRGQQAHATWLRCFMPIVTMSSKKPDVNCTFCSFAAFRAYTSSTDNGWLE